MNIFSGSSGRPLLDAGLRWLKAVAAGGASKSKLRGVKQAEFEQIAQDLNLSPAELYGLLAGRPVSAAALSERLAAEFEASPQLAQRLRAIERQHRAARIRLSAPVAPCC